MALAIQDRTEPSPYRKSNRERGSSFLKLATLATDQVQKVHSPAPSRPSFAFVSTATAISSLGLLGSPPRTEKAKPRTPAIGHQVFILQLPKKEFTADGDLSDKREKDWLRNALEELEQVDQEAAEEGFPLSDQSTKEIARGILNKLARRPTPAPTVYPTKDGAIAILFQNRQIQSAVLILCEQDGSGACFSTIGGKKRRARYDDASDLPDAFVISQLQMLSAI